MTDTLIDMPTPRWGLPYLQHYRFKGLKGGRGSGKSHFFAELLTEAMVMNKDLPAVCIREIQKSLQYSAKALVEEKIDQYNLGRFFDINKTEILRRNGKGVCIFQGMQDHTADSIKSLEGFKIAWVEEAQNLSSRSLRLLRPTIRAPGSEIWFSWNPDQPTDAVDKFFQDAQGEGVLLSHINYDQNPFITKELIEEMQLDQRIDPDMFGHVWLGEYNTKSDAQIFNGKYQVDEFEPQEGWDGPYYGADWGFSQDPTTLVRCWINGERLYIDYEYYKIGLEITDTPAAFKTIPGADTHTIRADNARPETISHVRRAGLNIVPAVKGKGSVEDGIAYIRGFEKVVIHRRCVKTADEFRLYRYKIDRFSGDILPDIIDAHNHCIDAIRYALEPMIKRSGAGGFIVL